MRAVSLYRRRPYRGFKFTDIKYGEQYSIGGDELRMNRVRSLNSIRQQYCGFLDGMTLIKPRMCLCIGYDNISKQRTARVVKRAVPLYIQVSWPSLELDSGRYLIRNKAVSRSKKTAKHKDIKRVVR